MARSSFGKREREQAKRAKAAAKRDRKQQPAVPDVIEETGAAAPNDGGRSTDELLEMIAEIHAQYDAGTISYEELESARTDLLSRLVVD
jgi:hypothetical protein